MSDQRLTRLPFCGNLTHGQIGKEFHAIYDNSHPDLTPWRVEEIHTRWAKLGKRIAAGSR